MRAGALSRWCVLALAWLQPAALASPVPPTEQAADGTPLFITRGMLEMPVRHANPAAGKLEVAYVRIQFDAEPTARAHLLLAGGPGASGVAAALSIARQGGHHARTLFGTDLIAMDQRGTGDSRPGLRIDLPYGIPLDVASEASAWQPFVESASRAAAAQLRARGIDLAAFTTRQSADDVEVLRQALGVKQWTLWGHSYGTRLALEVLRQHPETVRRLILVAPEGPGQTWKLPAATDEVLARIGQRAGQKGLPAQMRRVLERLRDQPRSVLVRDPVDGHRRRVLIGAFDVQMLSWRALGDPRTLATLPAAYARMAEGDFSAIAPLVLAMRQKFGPQSALKQVVDLSESAEPQRLTAIAAQQDRAVLGAAVNFPGPGLASAWGVEDAGVEARTPVTGPQPVLLLVGDLDARTPLANAHAIASGLPNAHVVRIIHAAHQFNVFGDERVRAVLAAFLAGRRVPAELALDSVFSP